MHLLDGRVEQNEDRQEGEEPNRCLILSREFAVRIGVGSKAAERAADVSRSGRAGDEPSLPEEACPSLRSEREHKREFAHPFKIDIAAFVQPFMRAIGKG